MVPYTHTTLPHPPTHPPLPSHQPQVHEDLRSKLKTLSGSILSTVRSACDEVVDNFLKINNIVANHKMTFMERASLRAECKRLTRFLRMMDIMNTAFLKTMVEECMLKLVQSVHSESLEPVTITGDDVNEAQLVKQRETNETKSPLFAIICNFDTSPDLTFEYAFKLNPQVPPL